LEQLPADIQHLTKGGESSVFLAADQDYYIPELKIALEDMHDENVLAKGNVLYRYNCLCDDLIQSIFSYNGSFFLFMKIAI
jgi:hypothetical protein